MRNLSGAGLKTNWLHSFMGHAASDTGKWRQFLLVPETSRAEHRLQLYALSQVRLRRALKREEILCPPCEREPGSFCKWLCRESSPLGPSRAREGRPWGMFPQSCSVTIPSQTRTFPSFQMPLPFLFPVNSFSPLHSFTYLSHLISPCP